MEVLMLKAIIRFFKSLNSNSHPGEIAHAVCLALILGFLPKDNLLWYVLTVFFFFMRINRGALIFFTFIFSLIAPALDNLFDIWGYAILNYEKFIPLFTKMLDTPFVAFTKFNNSIVMGSLAFSLMCYIPLYFLSRIIIRYWRRFLAPSFRKTKLYTILQQLPLVKKIGEMV